MLNAPVVGLGYFRVIGDRRLTWLATRRVLLCARTTLTRKFSAGPMLDKRPASNQIETVALKIISRDVVNP